MRRSLAIGCMALALANVVLAGPLDVKEVKLKNGLTVWLNEDHSQPKVWGAVVVRVGGADTPNEGIAHYFEHIMFKGTDQIGTKDYAKEKLLIDAISDSYDRLAKETDEAKRAEIQKEINRLNIEAAEYAIPNEFNRLINLYGGSGLNARTGDDMTMYYNTFSPQYMPQWLELNSHRLLNPVFRLFQGELESVYEEKNMYADNPLSAMMDDVRAKWFGTTPYAYPVLGSTENLKNPQMSRMRDFYKKYYVANNMALVLAGDLKAEDVEPLLEQTFGRIPAGADVPERTAAATPRHSGETIELKLPIPIVSMFGYMFDYPCNGHADEGAMEVATELLTNDSNTGLFDQIVTDGKALGVSGAGLQFDKAGAFFLLAVPNVLSSSAKLDILVWEKLDSLKAGKFSDNTFEAIKNSLVDNYQRSLETVGERGQLMVQTWANGKTWDEYLSYIRNLQNISRQDVMAAATKYLNRDNCMKMVKKFGTQSRDRLSQPGYKPIAPKRDDVESAYAKQLRESIPAQPFTPRLIDMKNDAQKTSLSAYANLYTVKNPVDSLFTLNVFYYCETQKDPMIDPLVTMFDDIGTQGKTRKLFNEELLRARATMTVGSTANGVYFTLEGRDSKFREALALLADMINNPKADKKTMDKVIDAIDVEDKSFNSENTEVLSALVSWLRYGNRSQYLTRATKKMLKKMLPEQLLSHFDGVKRAQMSVIYSGTLSNADVEQAVRELLPVSTPDRAAEDVFKPVVKDMVSGSETPTVYFYNMKKARQALVGTYSVLPAETTAKGRQVAAMWEAYFGSDMSSVMFQELREYRSLGYTCGAAAMYPQLSRHPDEPAALFMYVGTQADKTITAFEALDTIVRQIPLSESNFEAIKTSRLNSVNHKFPTFRGIGGAISNFEANGEKGTPYQSLVTHLPSITLQDVADFHNNTVVKAPHAYFVIGDKKSVDMKALAKIGKIVMVNDKQIYKKK